MDLRKYPVDDEDAEARADRFESDDPFKSVKRSLLSSAEIDDYARVTGMLSPYNPKQLKSASYEAYIGGEVISWDENDKKSKMIVNRGDPLTLPANSIVFVQVEPMFRLPNYIAIRFNLRISHVHRGLLLGTGPLVDPGFRGKLLIPLHNLTSSTYHLNTKDALIWIEFTKTTFGSDVSEELASEPRRNVLFPEGKRYLTPDEYFQKASGGNPIRSSIPDSVRQATESANSAREHAAESAAAAEQISQRFRNLGLSAAVGTLIVTLLTLTGLGYNLYQIGQQYYQMIQNTQSLVASVQQNVSTMVSDVKSASEKLGSSQSTIEKVSQRIDALSQDVEALKKPTVIKTAEPSVRKRARRRRTRG